MPNEFLDLIGLQKFKEHISAVATQNKDGFMSKEDKDRFDNEVANKDEIIGENLIPYPYYHAFPLKNRGITFTDYDGKGGIKANGTAPTDSQPFFMCEMNRVLLKANQPYTFASNCNNDYGFAIIWFKNLDGSSVTMDYTDIRDGVASNATANYISELRAGIKYDGVTVIPSQDVYIQFDVRFENKGETVTDAIFYPMLELGKIAHEYQPYNLSRKGIVEQIVGENLFPFPYKEMTKTQGDVVWSIDKQGIVTPNGTASAASGIYISTNFTLEKGTYTLSGCPKGGSSTTYRLQMANSDWSCNINDFGEGVTFTLTETTTFNTVRMYVSSGVAATGLVFKPMLEKGTVAHSFQPYNRSREGIIEQIVVDNLLIYPYVDTTRTNAGVTFTDLGDGTVRVAGTQTASTNFRCRSRDANVDKNQLTLPAGTYTVSGCPSGGSLTTYYLQCGYSGANGSWASLGNDYGDGAVFTLTTETTIQLLIIVDNDCPAIDVTFKPMIERGSVAHTWQPYKLSRQKLREDIDAIGTGGSENQNAFSNIKIDSTTIAADSKTDTLTLAGSNVTLTPDATNDKVTIGITKNNVTTALGYTPVNSVATTSANGLMSSTDKTKLDNTNMAYGTCSTAKDTAAKIITVSGNTNWKLTAGAMISIKFTATNTAQNPTFNVNGTGAKSVWYNTALITTSNLGWAGVANRPLIYMYDGTQYVYVGQSYSGGDGRAAQTNTTTNSDYRVLLSINANDTTETNGTRKSTNFRANPSTGAFYAKGYTRVDITGQTLDANTLTLEAGSPEIMKYICKTSGGSNNITNIPKTGNPFILDVELIRWASTTDYISRQIFVSIGDKYVEYIRYCTNGTWDTNWTKKVFTDHTYTNAALGQGYATCTTAADTVAKVATMSGYVLLLGGIVSVKFKYAVPANATLNINSKGAKNIFYRGAKITASVIKAGDIATFIYDGTQYHLISVDRGINNMLTTGNVVDNVTSTSTTLPLSANQGKGLNDRISKLQPHPYSLIRSLDIGPVSTTQTTYNTFNGRKISDYGMILITMGGSENDIRASLTVSRTQFDNTTTPIKTMYLDCWSANGTTFHQIAVKWVSDTQIMIYATTASTATKYVNISGIKVDDVAI